MMGYVVKGSEGEVVVIDGGRKEDAPFLRSFLLEHGGIVKRRMITVGTNGSENAHLKI